MRILNPAWLLLLFFCCCNKTQPTPTNRYEDFVFTTTYDSVITCYANSNYTFLFKVNVLSGNIANNRINYAVTGLPANITVIPASQSVAQLMGGAFTFTIGTIPPGYDTANFIIISANTGTQNHKLIFKVLPPVDYAPKLAGTYTNAYDYCMPSSIIHYTSVVTAVVDTPYEIKITNIKNIGAGFVVRAWVSHGVSIPIQTVDGYTIWGSGTFSHDAPPNDSLYQITIQDTLVHGVDTQFCTIHIQH